MKPQVCLIRPATSNDRDAVTAVISASYSELYAGWYPAPLLDAALPLMTKANPALLASGTYYVAELGSGIVGCGGWTETLPGGGEPVPGVGHIRHVATHPGFLGRGIGRRLMERCVADGVERGIARFECQSSFPAEAFYAKLGFRPTGPIEILLPGGIAFPGVHMQRKLR